MITTSRLLCVSLALFAVPAARAQFVGEVLLPVPGASYSSAGTVGAWSATFGGTSTGNFSTSGSPAITSLSLNASGFGGGMFQSVSLTHTFTQDGVFVFDASATVSTGGGGASGSVSWQKNGGTATTLTASGSMTGVTFNVVGGDTITLGVSASGGMTMITVPMFMMMSTSGSATGTFSNVSFTPSAVPEPASCALFAGGVLLAGASLRRRRR